MGVVWCFAVLEWLKRQRTWSNEAYAQQIEVKQT